MPLGSRLRASLALGRTKSGVALGYRHERSHDLIDVSVCPVLSPRVVERLPKLKQALAPLLGGKREASVRLTETENGLDVLLDGVRPAPAGLGVFAGKAASLRIARLTAGGGASAQRQRPR
jgi:23S rRNA (uracil1939-C5)-methyltransferase